MIALTADWHWRLFPPESTLYQATNPTSATDPTKSKASTICRESSSLSKSERWAAAGALDCVNEETVKLWCCSGM